jgi:DNA-binding NarL/FixJ family response regulator
MYDRISKLALGKGKAMRVLIVDDHPLIQEILPAMLKKAVGQVVVHLATDLAGALDDASRGAGPELVLLDLGLPDCTGIEALTRIRDRHPGAKIVVVSCNDDPGVIRAALKAGAAGYILKTYKANQVVAALRIIADGGTYVPSEILQADPADEKDLKLSSRQSEVLQLLLQGLSNRDIASQLHIAESTVKHHMGEIFETLRVSTRAEAMALAQRRGRQAIR